MARITGNPIADRIFGTTDNDNIFGLGGDDELYGAATYGAPSGNDSFHGGIGNDLMYGGDGNDTFYHESGVDVFSGGAGIDTIDFSDATAGFKIDMSYTNGSHSTHGDNTYGIERIIGSAFDDTIIGYYEPDTALYGAGGRDVVQGQGQADKLYGGKGNDIIWGYDTFSGSSEGDSLYGGGGSDNIGGSEQEDLIYGGDDKDTVYGGDGLDTIYGGAGADWLALNSDDGSVYGGKGADTFWFSSSEGGNRTIMDFNAARGDKLYFEWGGNVTSLEELTPFLTEEGGNLIVTLSTWLPDHDLIILGAEISDLTSENVDFWHF